MVRVASWIDSRCIPALPSLRSWPMTSLPASAAEEFFAATSFLVVPSDDSVSSRAKRSLWACLSPSNRALMATDGSFTSLLAAVHGDSIRTETLAQCLHVNQQTNTVLGLEKGDQLLRRRVLMTLISSDRPVAHAESSIVLNRVGMAIAEGLREGSKPIGLLLRQNAVETHRQLQDWGECPPGHKAGRYFDEAKLMFRTYLVISHREPIMSISECFPATEL